MFFNDMEKQSKVKTAYCTVSHFYKQRDPECEGAGGLSQSEVGCHLPSGCNKSGQA